MRQKRKFVAKGGHSSDKSEKGKKEREGNSESGRVKVYRESGRGKVTEGKWERGGRRVK